MSARQIASLFFGLLFLYLVYDSVYTVGQSQRVILLEMEHVQTADLAPGLHFKLPLAQRVIKLDGRTQTLDDQTDSFPTADQKILQADYFVRWRIADPVMFYRRTGGQRLVASDHLSAMAERAVRDAFAARTVTQIVGSGHDAMIQALAEALKDPAAELGVALVDVRFERIDLPDPVADSVYQRMRAEQNRIAADLRARAAESADKIRAQADAQAEVILADAYRDAEKLRGEGDAKAAEIYAHAYGQDPEFFRFYRSINAYRDAFQSGKDVLVLQPRSEFFRYFGDAGGKH
jgi:membrane protease subunit HflC